MKIAKEFNWEMGHRLPEHFGPCTNIHGHSYKMIVEFEGELNKEGMVIDFYDVENIVDSIINELDHAFMVKNDDKITIDFLNKLNSKKVVVDFVATAENICKFIADKIIKTDLPGNIEKIAVRIYETPDDYAEETRKL
ncbi:MAG: 6-carboxytetrahydropterin synthase [Ignavibacteria bacterium]|jgi:6-pyruvoyltetrahydropterin/6-carboxytetrahydropterin synthase